MDYYQLEQLLLHKSYEQLTAKEQAVVASYCSEVDYRLQRQILLAASPKTIVVPPSASTSITALQAQLKQQYGANRWVQKIKKIIGLLLLLLIATMVGYVLGCCQQKRGGKSPASTSAIRVKDTIWEQQIVHDTLMVYESKVEYIRLKSDTIYLPNPMREQQRDTTGKSMKNRADLWQLMATIKENVSN